MIPYALIIAAFVLFVIAAIGVPSGRINLVAAGLSCLTLAGIIGRRLFAPMLLGTMILSGCADMTPAQKTALVDVTNTALGVGLGYLSGGVPGAIAGAAPSLVTDVQDASYALRTLQNPASSSVPSSAAITSTIALIAGSPAVAKAIGPKVSSAVLSAVVGGVSPANALEAAATGLDKAVAKVPVKSAAFKPRMPSFRTDFPDDWDSWIIEEETLPKLIWV
jgi:hypothetical protein